MRDLAVLHRSDMLGSRHASLAAVQRADVHQPPRIPPRPPSAVASDRRASVYTFYTSPFDADGRQTHEGREVLPLPAPVTSCHTRYRART